MENLLTGFPVYISPRGLSMEELSSPESSDGTGIADAGGCNNMTGCVMSCNLDTAGCEEGVESCDGF
jgi:hypothetical protein